MKKVLTIILSFATVIALAQVPQKISYQAVARQVSGAVLPNQTIGVEFIIYQTSVTGTMVYKETHNTNTNGFGLFSLFIGGGTPVAGSFASINWSTGIYFVETLIDPAGGTSYSSVGTQQLMSVPYALYAETSGNSSSNPTITINSPNTITNPSSGIYNISVPSYSAGTGISIASGVISNTGSSSSSTITGLGLAVVSPTTGNVFSVSVPNPTLAIGSGSLSISNGNTVALPSYSLSQGGSNINLLQNGTSIATVTLATGTSYVGGTGISISSGTIINTAPAITPTIIGTGMAVVTPSVGNNFTVSVPAQTLSVGSGSLTLSSGNSIPLPTHSLSVNSNSLTLNGLGGNTVTLPVTSIISGTNVIVTGTPASYTVSAVTPTLVVTGSGFISGAYPNQTINIPAGPTQFLSINVNTISLNPGGGSVVIPTQTLSLTGSTLTSGVASNSVNLALLPSVWTKSLTNIYPTILTDKVGIGTTTPNNMFQVANLISFEPLGSNTSLGPNTGTGITPNNFANTFVGYNAGQSVGTGTTSNNSYFGVNSGQAAANAVNNSFFGSNAGKATTGSYNSIIGGYSGFNNTTGNYNLFAGYNSGLNNTTANNNTFLGANADLGSAIQRINATAIGYNAKVDTNNAIILGAISPGVNVGIGTTKPASSLHITNNIGAQLRLGHGNQPALEWYFDVSSIAHMSLVNENNGTPLNVMDFNTITGRVGIGVTNPGYKLSVNGGVGDDVASVYASNSSTNTAVASHGVYGLSNNTFSLSAGVYGNNTSVGPSIFGSKTNTQTGIAGRFELANTGNSADAVMAITLGTGAAIHAVCGPTVSGSSNVALNLEDGHIKSKQSLSTISVTTVSTSISFSGATFSTANCTDVKGSLLAVCTVTSVSSVYANSIITFKVNFGKTYQIIPTVIVISPTDLGNLTYFVSNITASSFNITLRNNTAATIVPPSLTFPFNYIVIE